MLSNLLIEMFWNTCMALAAYLCWYYPIGLYQNANLTHDVASRGGLTFLFIWAFMMFTSTSTHILVAGIDSADSAGSVGNICYMLCISFCGYVPYSSLLCFPLCYLRVCFAPFIMDSNANQFVSQFQQHPREKGFPTRILDIHVLHLPVHLARLRPSLHRCSQYRDRLCIE